MSFPHSNSAATTSQWKFSQIISLSFVSLILLGAFIGVVGADNTLLSDGLVQTSMSPQGAL